MNLFERGSSEQEKNSSEISERLKSDSSFREEIKAVIRDIEYEKSREAGKKEMEGRKKELSIWLDDFNVEGLSLDSPKNAVRGIMEQYGVYLRGEHIGDIYSDSIRFSKDDFYSKVLEVLKNAGVERRPGGKNELLGSRVTIKIDEKILDEITRSGVQVSGDQWTFKNLFVDLYGKGENALVRVIEGGDGKLLMIITEKGGKVIEYDIEDGNFNLESRREV